MYVEWEWNGQLFNSDEYNLNEEPDPLDPRFILRHSDTRYIALSNRWSLDVIVDAIDYDFLSQWLWTQTYGSGERKFGSQLGKDKIYARRTEKGKCIWLHRVVTQRAYGDPPSPLHVSDHLNGRTLDCRRKNLRWATLSENNRNRFGTAWLQGRLFND